MRLTDLLIKSIELPAEGTRIYHDDLIKSFGVRVSAGGRKTFVLTHGARRKRESIGRAGIISLQEARAEAKRRLAEYTLGRTRPDAVNWNVAMEEYLKEKSASLRPRTLVGYKRIFKRYFRYGDTKLHELSARDFGQSLEKLARLPGQHKAAFGVLRAFMRWAYRRRYIAENPIARLDTPKGCEARERVLSEEELRRVWLQAGDDTYGQIIKLLILTGQRRGEITALRTDMVRDDLIVFPASLTKNGREHRLPLGKTARQVLESTRPRDGYFFPGRGSAGPFDGFSKCKAALDERCGVRDWRLHDLRRTFASGMAPLGVSLPVVERLLNHISGSFGGIVGVYQRYDFMREMREAIEKWERQVTEITAGRGQC